MTEMGKKSARHIPAVLLVVSLYLAVVMALKVMAFATASTTISARIANAVDSANCKDEELKTYTVKYTDLAGELKDKSVFAPPPAKKSNPVKQVAGIFGDEALINGKFYKVGGKIGEAELIEIRTTYVVVKFDGKETKLAPIARATEYKTPVKKPESKKKKEPVKKIVASVEEETEQAEETETTVDEDEFAWVGVKLSPAMKAKFLEQWNKMTDEQKEMGKKQWSRMSQEQKEQAVSQMERHM